jgi:hypothetical protein
VSDESNTERLMNALITKMESMDNSLHSLKQENIELKKMIQQPRNLLKRAGFVSVRTPFSEDVEPDGFRGDLDLGEATLTKAANLGEMSNEEVHNMSWDDIHELAGNVKEVEALK